MKFIGSQEKIIKDEYDNTITTKKFYFLFMLISYSRIVIDKNNIKTESTQFSLINICNVIDQ